MTEAQNAKPDDTAIELLSFRVADQEYSVDIMSVREIRSNTQATPLPHAPSYVRGVINLRGTVLPIIDLAQRLEQGSCSTKDRAVIIVVAHQDQVFGLLVDAVSDILEVSETNLQSPPEVAGDQSAGMVRALTIVEEKMIRILDLSAILSNAIATAA